MGGKLALGPLLQEWDTTLRLGLGFWPRVPWDVMLRLEAISSINTVRSELSCTFLAVIPS
eukprot:5624632-Pyramimonas_sp.AAC.1